MSYIKNITDNTITEINYIVNGIDILGDVLGNNGFMCDDDGWLLDSHDIEWWTSWVRREKAIKAAYEDANEETRKAFHQAIIESGSDLEVLQDELEHILGIH